MFSHHTHTHTHTHTRRPRQTAPPPNPHHPFRAQAAANQALAGDASRLRDAIAGLTRAASAAAVLGSAAKVLTAAELSEELKGTLAALGGGRCTAEGVEVVLWPGGEGGGGEGGGGEGGGGEGGGGERG